MNRLIEMHVRYRGSERFLRLAQSGGEWSAVLLVPGKEDMFGECPPRAPLAAILPAADLDGRTFRIEAPEGNVASLAALTLITAGVAVRNGWIEVPLCSIMRDYHDCEGDRLPEPEQAQILEFPKQKARTRDGGMER